MSFLNPADPAGTTEILISLAFSNETQLDQLLAELQNSSSPSYHQYLTHAQFDQEFGATPAVYSSLVSYLQSFGVSQLTTHPDRLTVTFEATPAQITSIFSVQVQTFVSSSGQTYFAPTSLPTLPSPLAPYITDVEGLSNYSEYLDHVDLQSVIETATEASAETAATGASPDLAEGESTQHSGSPAIEGSSTSPGGGDNPFQSTTVTSNGLTNTYDVPPLNTSQTNAAQGLSGSCGTAICGEQIPLADLQVTYNETGLFEQYGYPVNASVAALLWTDPVCTQDTGTCATDSYYNSFCSTLSSDSYAWDFFMPDVTSYWNYTIPAGEPMPIAIPLGISGGPYAYPTGSQGYSASCDSGGAEEENTLDVDAMGTMAPGANVFDVFSDGATVEGLTTAFSDIISPRTTEFSTTGGYDTAVNMAKLGNLSAIDNSWTTQASSLGAAWTTDLEEAATLGITVEGSTGDGGTTIAVPAAEAYNTYGTIAVGGTTVVTSQSSLERTPAHAATMAAPYYGVGGGEIGWYEPVETVVGLAGYGSTGGVSTTTTYWRATWFNASSDASNVANAVQPGNYRAEPDVAAIANDTFIDYDQGPYSLNITCLAVGTAHCTAVSSMSVGVTNGSKPTLGWTYFVGTSIAGQVFGGEIAVIDHALYVEHQGRLGFSDPSFYQQGQLQYTSQLSLHSFYDVTVYTGGGGLTPDYEAKVGYDLATGWGVLDAGNYTQNVMTYNATFVESGLPTGAQWSVTVTPTVGDANCVLSGDACANGAAQTATFTGSSSTITFRETYGAYTYVISSGSGYSASPSSGTFSIDGANVPISAGFSSSSPVFAATFTESGLTGVFNWSVTVDSYPYASSASSITVSGLSGTATYTVNPADGYAIESGASGVVTAAAPGAVVTFAPVPMAPGQSEPAVTGATSIALSWREASANIVNYTVYAYTGSTCAGTSTSYSTGTGTTYSVTGLSPTTEYCFTVVAWNNGGPSPTSNPETATTLLEVSVPTVNEANAPVGIEPGLKNLNVTATLPSGGTAPYSWQFNYSQNGAGYAPVPSSWCNSAYAGSGWSSGDQVCDIGPDYLITGDTYTFELYVTDSGSPAVFQTSGPSVPVLASNMTLSLSEGTAGTSVSFYANLSPGADYTLYLDTTQGVPDHAAWAFSTEANSPYILGSFPVPSLNAGTYYADIFAGWGDLTSADWVAPVSSGSGEFTILAIPPPTITVSPAAGAVGQSYSVSGSGFTDSSQVNVLFGAVGSEVPQTPASCSTGSFSGTTILSGSAGRFVCKFVIPSGTPGTGYDVYAMNMATSMPSAATPFTVNPPPTLTVTVSPTSEAVGQSYSVSGSGFTNSSGVGIYFGLVGEETTQTPTSCSTGSFSGATITTGPAGRFVCAFTVPQGATVGNDNAVYAVDSATSTQSAPTPFTVNPPPTLSVTVSPSSGAVGQSFSVSGSGFTNSSGVNVYFGLVGGETAQVPASCSTGSFSGTTITTGPKGAFACKFTVPDGATVGGDNAVYAVDLATSTQSSSTPFTVNPPPTPSISVSVTSGPAGTAFKVTGTGFTNSSGVTLDFGGTALTPTACSTGSFSGTVITTGPAGKFVCTFTVPSVSTGEYSIQAEDVATTALSNAPEFDVT